MTYECERQKQGVDEVDLREAGRPTHYRCRGCLDTFPVIGDTDAWECPGPWWRNDPDEQR